MSHPTLVIGRTYFVDNPAAKSYLGKLIAIIDPFTVALEEASWIANTGRFHVFIRYGRDTSSTSPTEKEYCGFVAAARYQSINEWNHPLDKESY